MKKKMQIIKVGETLFSIDVTGVKQMKTIYLTGEQIDKLNEAGEWRVSLRKTTYIYPLFIYIEKETGKKKEVHIGNFLYPGNKRAWDMTMWKGKEWDFSPENLNIEGEKYQCGLCQTWRNLAEKKKGQSRDNNCPECKYLNDTVRNSYKRVGVDSELKVEMYAKIKKCELTDIPLTYGTNTGLRAASLQRISNKLGYTEENTRLVCQGISAIRHEYTEAELKEYLSKYETMKSQEMKLTPFLKIKLGEFIINHRKRTPNCDYDIQYLWEKLQETKGICKIVGVPMDLEWTRPSALDIPSVDRIDSSKEYMRGNIQIVSFGGNIMKKQYSTEEAQEFIEEVMKSPILERLGTKRKIGKSPENINAN